MPSKITFRIRLLAQGQIRCQHTLGGREHLEARGCLQRSLARRESAEHVLIAPGPRHWSIFARLVRESGCRGNLIPDAFLAAIAIESGCTWISTDRDYSRFNGLDWRHPLDS